MQVFRTRSMLSKKIFNSFSSSVRSSKGFASVNIDLPKWEGIELDLNQLPTTTTTTKEELMSYFKQLHTMRRMEIECDTLYKAREIRGFCHLYIGQEAIAAGMEAAITKDDCVVTGYREHCNYLARGDTPHRILAEMMSRSTGSTHGKGGSMHYYSRKNNFYGGHGIVGAQIALGTGLAFALKYQNMPNVAIAMYGDGCCNQGQLYESSNMAGLLKLPMIYCCENNHYGMGTSEQRGSYVRPIYSKFRGFAGIKCEGSDIFSVREAVKFCREYALKNGPIFLEIDTYRYQGHSMSDPGSSYRTKEEVTQYRETKDCINKVKQQLLKNSFATESELKAIEKEIKEQLVKAVEQAKADPLPEANELATHVEVGGVPFIRGVEYPNSYFYEHKQ